MSPVLELVGIGKSFGRFTAVDRVDLTLAAGEIRALIGPNGAGKSTLLNLASGALQPSRGRVQLDGRDITGLPPHRLAHAGLGRSFQITSIFPRMSVADNVRIALMSRHRQCRRLFMPARTLQWDRVEALLAQVHLDDQPDRAAGELAAGDRKRLEFAITLAGEPKVILLDEPTAGMSVAERELVGDVLLALNRREGVAILFTEHDIDMVFRLAGSITVLHGGAVVAEGEPNAVRANPRVQEIYLAEPAHV